MTASAPGSAVGERVRPEEPAGEPARSPVRDPRRVALGAFRLAIAAIEVVALIGNFTYVLGFRLFATVNFFSYFTVQSAMLAVVTLLIAAWYAIMRPRDPVYLGILRTMVTVYLVVSGIVFGLIVAQASSVDYRVDVPWSDTLLHFVVPALALVAWTVDAVIAVNPPVPWATVGWALVFPTIWLVYTLLRGADVGWYPYFFLDDTQVGGFAGVITYCAVVLAIFVAVTSVLVAVHRGYARRAARRADATA